MATRTRRTAASIPDPGKIAKFEIPWKITEEQFDAISTTKLTKYFITVHNKIAYNWRAELVAGTEDGKVCFIVHYDSGPSSTIKPSYKLWVKKRDDTYKNLISESARFYRNDSRSSANFAVSNGSDFKEKHSCDYFGDIFFTIALKISVSKFGGVDDDDNEDVAPNWLKHEYYFLTYRNEVKYSDVTLISADKQEFYCHRLVIGTQSHGFDAMFRNASTEEEKKGVFRFPTVNGNILSAALKFLYSANYYMRQLSLSDVMVLADFSEQYGIKKLKKNCIFELWYVIVDFPTECGNLIRFADLHDDMKHVKDRCFEILAEQFYDELPFNLEEIFKRSTKKRKRGDAGGDNQDDRLRKEFDLYLKRRVVASFV